MILRTALLWGYLRCKHVKSVKSCGVVITATHWLSPFRQGLNPSQAPLQLHGQVPWSWRVQHTWIMRMSVKQKWTWNSVQRSLWLFAILGFRKRGWVAHQGRRYMGRGSGSFEAGQWQHHRLSSLAGNRRAEGQTAWGSSRRQDFRIPRGLFWSILWERQGVPSRPLQVTVNPVCTANLRLPLVLRESLRHPRPASVAMSVVSQQAWLTRGRKGKEEEHCQPAPYPQDN